MPTRNHQKINIDITIRNKDWERINRVESLIRGIAIKLIIETEINEILKSPKCKLLNLDITLVNDRQIKAINCKFRNKNKATDILSFPMINCEEIKNIGLKHLLKKQENIFLGDIVICLETIRKDTIKSGKGFKNHLYHLLLHSILHLIGYDHINYKDAKKMEDVEISILRKFGISNPYIS